MDLTQILIGSLLLSVVHAAIPNHWLPLVAMGRAEHWGHSETLVITAIAGLAHAASSVLLGILIGWLGYELSTQSGLLSRILAPSLLVAMGLAYFLWDVVARAHHHHTFGRTPPGGKISKLSIAIALSLTMFLSPCIEIDAYYFTAGARGWPGILLVSLIYLMVTVSGMLLLVDLGLRGAEKIRSPLLEHHEKRVTGLVLVALGVATFFVVL